MVNTVADPGFAVGGADSQGSYISKVLYVNAKESGPLGRIRQSMHFWWKLYLWDIKNNTAQI